MLYIWLTDCRKARKRTRLKISCSVVYSKPQNSVWIKSYTVSTVGHCLYEISRTLRNGRQGPYCKSVINVRNIRTFMKRTGRWWGRKEEVEGIKIKFTDFWGGPTKNRIKLRGSDNKRADATQYIHTYIDVNARGKVEWLDMGLGKPCLHYWKAVFELLLKIREDTAPKYGRIRHTKHCCTYVPPRTKRLLHIYMFRPPRPIVVN